MRARNIKPSLFKNELLAIADPIYTVVFAGLWCLADRRGRLEDRPAKIHFDINPGRAFEGTSVALAWLADNGFVQRYEVNGTRYVQILNFEKHQSPHHMEQESVIPPMPEANASCTKVKPEASPPSTVRPQGENPSDSGFLIPDPGLLVPPPEAASRFDEIRNVYPKRSGSHRWQDAEGAYRARLREGHTHADILAGVLRYADFVKAEGNEGSSFVQQAATFLGTNKGFLEDWKLVAKSAKATPAPKRSREWGAQ